MLKLLNRFMVKFPHFLLETKGFHKIQLKILYLNIYVKMWCIAIISTNLPEPVL